MNKLARFAPLAALFLFFASCAHADTLQVSFSVSFVDSVFFNSETISGSFLWNTSTNVLFDVSVTSTGPVVFGPSASISGLFVAPPGFTSFPGCPFYPTGTLEAFFISDITGTGNIQMNLGDHADCDPPVIPGPGTYASEPFDLVPPGGGVVPSMAPDPVSVREVPEPGPATLLGLGAFALAAALARRKLST